MKRAFISMSFILLSFVAGWLSHRLIQDYPRGDLQRQFIDAVKRGDTKTMQSLSARGAHLNVGHDWNSVAPGFAPIIEAAWSGQPDSIQWLLDHQVDPNQQQADTRPLSAARYRLEQVTKTIKILEAHGAKEP